MSKKPKQHSVTAQPWEPAQNQLNTILQSAEQQWLQGNLAPPSPGGTTQQAQQLGIIRAMQGNPLLGGAQNVLSGIYEEQTNPAISYAQQFASGNQPINPASTILGNLSVGSGQGSGAKTLLSAARGEFLGQNPYAQDQFSNIANEIQDRVNSQFGAAGRGGSGMHAATTAREIGRAGANFFGNLYNQERANQLGAAGQIFGAQLPAAQALGNLGLAGQQQQLQGIGMLGSLSQGDVAQQLQAAGMAPTLGAADWGDIGQLANIGQQQDYAAAQQSPYAQLQNYLGLVQPIGALGSQSSQPIYQNTGAGLLGGALGGAGLGQTLGSTALGPWAIGGALLGGLF